VEKSGRKKYSVFNLKVDRILIKVIKVYDRAERKKLLRMARDRRILHMPME
jgi:hypothetical protein